MPKELKDDVGEKLNKTAKELYDIDNFTDMIADETICTDCDALMSFLQEKNAPSYQITQAGMPGFTRDSLTIYSAQNGLLDFAEFFRGKGKPPRRFPRGF